MRPEFLQQVARGGHGASPGHPTPQLTSSTVLCAALRVLMTVALRPGCTSEIHDLVKEHGLPSSEGKLGDTKNCTVKYPVAPMCSQTRQPRWPSIAWVPLSGPPALMTDSVATTSPAGRCSMILLGGGRAPGSTCKVRSYAMSKFLPVADTCAHLAGTVGGASKCKGWKPKPDSPPDCTHPLPPGKTLTKTSHSNTSPGICPNPAPQHNDPLERTRAQTGTYLWST